MTGRAGKRIDRARLKMCALRERLAQEAQSARTVEVIEAEMIEAEPAPARRGILEGLKSAVRLPMPAFSFRKRRS
jgi:hypothetical protein